MVVEHDDEYTIEELQDFCLELQQTSNDQVASDEEEETGDEKTNEPSSHVKNTLRQGTGIYREKNQWGKTVTRPPCLKFI